MISATSEQMSKVEGILQQLDCAQSRIQVDNRRSAPRVNVRLALEVLLIGGPNPATLQIFTRNLSVSGVGFVSRRPFKPDERIVIKMRVKGTPQRIVLARVTFGRYISGGMHECGAEFLDCIDDKGHTTIPAQWLINPVPARIEEKPARPAAATSPLSPSAAPNAPATPKLSA